MEWLMLLPLLIWIGFEAIIYPIFRKYFIWWNMTDEEKDEKIKEYIEYMNDPSPDNEIIVLKEISIPRKIKRWWRIRKLNKQNKK